MINFENSYFLCFFWSDLVEKCCRDYAIDEKLRLGLYAGLAAARHPGTLQSHVRRPWAEIQKHCTGRFDKSTLRRSEKKICNKCLFPANHYEINEKFWWKIDFKFALPLPGKMIDYVKCLECGTEKQREDTFLDIPLPVRPFGSNVAYNSVVSKALKYYKKE